MPKEPKLDMLPDKDMKLSGEHFRKVVRRIESIVPIAGGGIIVEPVDGGHKISINEDEQLIEGYGVCNFAAQGYDQLFDIIQLNVCSNGSPDTVYVFAPKGQNAEVLLCEV